MQKKLIAAAVAGLIAVPALAQTNVTISGRFAVGYQNYSLSGGGTTGKDTYNGISDQSSRLIFNVVEDLGGGLKAWGQVDSRFAPDVGGATWAGGNTGMGLMGSWGKFTMGRWDVHYTEIAGGTNAGTPCQRPGEHHQLRHPGSGQRRCLHGVHPYQQPDHVGQPELERLHRSPGLLDQRGLARKA